MIFAVFLLFFLLVASLVAVFVWLISSLYQSAENSDTDLGAYAPPSQEELDEFLDECPICRGSGLRDGAGFQPWGDPILVKCDCPAGETAVPTWPVPNKGRALPPTN